MDRTDITNIAGSEFSRLMPLAESKTDVQIFRRPEAKDEVDRMARQMVKRMMEAGVIDPL